MTHTTVRADDRGAERDPVLTAIIANRIDGIVREMTNTLLRAARSAVINSARDFSCGICTADNQLLACADGLPIHSFGANLQTRTLCEMHPALREGDAFLHNDPYTGNTHPADHTFMVPVFIDGEHLFTAVAKAHQADIGNSRPTTYHVSARDIYEEGALIFPAVQIQRDYQMIDDIVRMCRSRIRVPGQWYGDFLAGLGAARIAERRLKALCVKYGKNVIRRFIGDWLDYSEQRMAQAIRRLPKATLRRESRHDPIADVIPEGIPVRATLSVDPAQPLITVDLRDNVPNVACGLNLSEACSISAALTGIFNSLPADIPKNAGTFRCVKLLLDEGKVIGRPRHPFSCSVATTNISDRLVNLLGSAMAELGEGLGVAEGGIGMGVGMAVISGTDPRNGEGYVNQLIIANNGGPASAHADGWVTYELPDGGGLTYRDSVEINEMKHPIKFERLRLMPGSGGAGKFRGSPGGNVAYSVLRGEMRVIYPCDGQISPGRGVRGGADGSCASGWLITVDGRREKLPNSVDIVIRPGEIIEGFDCSGGGYGNPLTRDPARVLHDVAQRWETIERARDIYGVILTGDAADETLAVDVERTLARRAELHTSLTSLQV
ncbi:hydantoinase B/oxoprolinase family protein [Martelella alba]|uniref:Hydantoinase B/oxoprolinase family protein n=1 Tax=Martelella alba TaxID=2590451 RepID=A0ABY2SKJ8_9HYPH|nr:hydantoinase B/oxoprolinase family protein [Martelella alba]TKI05282.1 hydantoinase B/oxoprolinase family protein [Martelella alba]